MGCTRTKPVHLPDSALLVAIFLSLYLTWTGSTAHAAVYHYRGKCVHVDKVFLSGQAFMKGCKKCFCHDTGFFCLSPKKPTAWPEECQRISAECGYRVVFRDNPDVDCRAYSWIG